MREADKPRVIIKKKGGGHAAHHGGAWKVAYADFVTAMMALFMVMWLLASTDQKSREEISKYFRTGILPEGSLSMQSAAQIRPSVMEEAPVPPVNNQVRMDAQAEELRQEVKKMVEQSQDTEKMSAQFSVSATPEGVVIEAIDSDQGESMLFDQSSAQLKPALQNFIKRVAVILAKKNAKIKVAGHTDARPFVSKDGKSNWDLSYERASAARQLLEQSGLRVNQVSGVEAFGATKPRVKDAFAAQNRRLAIIVEYQSDKPTPPLPDSLGTGEAAPSNEPAGLLDDKLGKK